MTKRIVRALRSLRRRLRLSAEDGSLLIEVMVGAIVLAITTHAVLSGLEGAADTGLKNRQRSAGATLAQQDIERLRAFPVTALSNYRETRTVDLNGVPYSVTSRTDWVRDSAELSCTDSTPEAEYLKITSTAQPPNDPERAVTEVSLLTPAPGAFADTAGTAAVRITGRTGLPVPAGTDVSISGPSSATASTNSLGCAVFDFVPAGSYTIDVPGYVTWTGESGSTMTVVAGKSTLNSLEMEPPASLRAQFELPPGAPATATQALWSSMTVTNAKLPGGAAEFTAASPVTSIDGTGLFPFLDGFGVYAGTCSRNNPAFHQSNYYSVSGGKGTVQLDPGDLLKSVQVQMGTVRITVRSPSSGNPVISGALVTLRQDDNATGCNRDLLMASGTTDANGLATFVVPFGTYRVCASGLVGSTTRFRQSTTNGGSGAPAHPIVRPRSSQAWSTSMNPSGTATLPNSGSSGACSTALDTSP
jgi:Tfp pilus assembly protein PilV